MPGAIYNIACVTDPAQDYVKQATPQTHYLLQVEKCLTKYKSLLKADLPTMSLYFKKDNISTTFYIN